MPNINKIGRVTTGELTPKEIIFAYEYLTNGLNASKAYQYAYDVKFTVAKAEGYRLLQSDRVKNFIKQKNQEMYMRYDITLDRIYNELAACGFSKATDVIGIDGDGNALYNDTRVLDEGTQRAISEVSVIGGKVNVKMHDKVKALQSLAKYQGAELEFNQILLALDRMGFDVIRGGNGKLAFVERGGSVLSIDDTVAKMIQLQESAIVNVESKTQQLNESEVNSTDSKHDATESSNEPIVEQGSLLFNYEATEEEELKLQLSEEKFNQKLDGILRNNPYK
jgi:phage terminase small subunit